MKLFFGVLFLFSTISVVSQDFYHKKLDLHLTDFNSHRNLHVEHEGQFVSVYLKNPHSSNPRNWPVSDTIIIIRHSTFGSFISAETYAIPFLMGSSAYGQLHLKKINGNLILYGLGKTSIQSLEDIIFVCKVESDDLSPITSLRPDFTQEDCSEGEIVEYEIHFNSYTQEYYLVYQTFCKSNPDFATHLINFSKNWKLKIKKTYLGSSLGTNLLFKNESETYLVGVRIINNFRKNIFVSINNETLIPQHFKRTENFWIEDLLDSKLKVKNSNNQSQIIIDDGWINYLLWDKELNEFTYGTYTVVYSPGSNGGGSSSSGPYNIRFKNGFTEISTEARNGYQFLRLDERFKVTDALKYSETRINPYNFLREDGAILSELIFPVCDSAFLNLEYSQNQKSSDHQAQIETAKGSFSNWQSFTPEPREYHTKIIDYNALCY